MWSEDMAFMQQERPGSYFLVGARGPTAGHGAAAQRALRHRRAGAGGGLRDDGGAGSSWIARPATTFAATSSSATASPERPRPSSCASTTRPARSRSSATSPIRSTTASRCRRCCARQIPEAKVMIRNLAWHEEHRIDAASAHARRAHRSGGARRRGRRQVLSVRCAADRDRRPTQSDRQARLGRRGEPTSRFSTSTTRARSPNRSIGAARPSRSADRSSPTSWPKPSRRAGWRRIGSCAARAGCIGSSTRRPASCSTRRRRPTACTCTTARKSRSSCAPTVQLRRFARAKAPRSPRSAMPTVSG